MTDDGNREELRTRLAERLRRLIGNPGVEAKELAAFDVVMSRRTVLKASSYAAVAGLVAAGSPPTLWGRKDPALAVDPAEVGLSASQMAAVNTATQLSMGTELFQEPVYAEQAVSPGLFRLSAVVEGAQPRAKLQSRFDHRDPLEATFLDTGYHYGQPELIQAEQLDDKTYRLVHYHHPWGARGDGGQSDGQVADVLMTAADGLSLPGHVLTVTGPDTNASGAAGTSQATYLVVVHDGAAPGNVWVLFGRGAFDVEAVGRTDAVYPVEWSIFTGEQLGISNDEEITVATSYTDLGFEGYDGSAPPAPPTEYAVLYTDQGVHVIGVNSGAEVGVNVTHITYPPDTEGGWGLASFAKGHPVWVQYVGGRVPVFTTLRAAEKTKATTTSLGSVSLVSRSYDSATFTGLFEQIRRSAPGPVPDMGSLRDSHMLYRATDEKGIFYDVHLGLFEDFIALYTVAVLPDNLSPDQPGAGYFSGMFPLAGTSLVTPLSLSGGVSKFGGYRFVALDDEGNLFIARQRRLKPDDPGATPPYLAPIFGPYTADGQVVDTPYTAVQPVPSGMPDDVATSIENWVLATNGYAVDTHDPSIAIMQAAAAMFATDGSYAGFGACLGQGFQAAHAPSRYAWDSSHVAVTRTQSSAPDDDDYAAYLMACNPVTKCWHERLIAVQTTPKPPGENESGDHYQLSIGMANVYGQTVRPSDNPGMAIEVRSDVPTTVTDTTHNVYYDLDRYTSFIAAPDPANARLEVVIKATTMAEILYARLIDTTRLQPSDDDPSLLTSSADDPPDWQPVNVSAQAQQRMGNGAATSPLELLGDDAPVPDTNLYVTEDTLTTSMTPDPTTNNPGWNFKSGFSSSTKDLPSNLASYLNASGTNLVIASSQGNLGASDSDGVDPLTSMTSTINGSLLGTSPSTTGFIYQAGSAAASITYDNSGKTPTQVGSIWSGISHALHDALHWLQHAATETIDALGSATVTMIQDTDAITAVVSKEIMKAVNGVEKELQQVVSTVEEYGNVLVNVVVSIVEASFIYQMIAEIIALISMFLHFGKMWNLKGDLQGRVLDILSGDFNPDENNPSNPPTVPEAFSSYEKIAPYLPGGGSTVTGPSGDDAGSSLPGSVLTDVLNNPIVKKILNAIMKETNAALNAAEDALPIKFNVDDVANVVDLSELSLDVFDTDDFVAAVETLATDLLDALVDPEEFYETITDRLQAIINELIVDAEQALETVLDAVDDLARGNGGMPPYATQLTNLLNANEFLEINLTWLADFLKLFGVDVGSGKVTLKATDAIFLPMAIVLWTTAYMRDGMVISKLDDIDGTVSLEDPTQGEYVLWDAIRLGVDFTLSTLTGIAWLTTASVPKTKQSPGAKILLTVAPYLGAMRMLNDFAYTYGSKSLGAPPSTDPAWLNTMYAVERGTAIWWRIAGTLTTPKGSTDTPWQTNVADVADILMYLVQTVVEAVVLVEEGEKDDLTAAEIVAFVGKVMTRLQRYMRTMWRFFQTELEDNPDVLTTFGTVIFAAPYGNLVQEAALAMSATTEQPPPPPGTDNPRRQGPPPGRPRRPNRHGPPPGRPRRPNRPPE